MRLKINCKLGQSRTLPHIIPVLGLKLIVPLKMLVLYETSLGFCLFKLNDEAKLTAGDLWKDFETPKAANKL